MAWFQSSNFVAALKWDAPTKLQDSNLETHLHLPCRSRQNLCIKQNGSLPTGWSSIMEPMGCKWLVMWVMLFQELLDSFIPLQEKESLDVTWWSRIFQRFLSQEICNCCYGAEVSMLGLDAQAEQQSINLEQQRTSLMVCLCWSSGLMLSRLQTMPLCKSRP
jgi:hypothetical protein